MDKFFIVKLKNIEQTFHKNFNLYWIKPEEKVKCYFRYCSMVSLENFLSEEIYKANQLTISLLMENMNSLNKRKRRFTNYMIKKSLPIPSFIRGSNELRDN